MFSGRNLVRKLVGNEGKGVGKHEEVQMNLLVCSVGAGVAGGGLPAVSRSSGEVRAVGGHALVREDGMGRSGSFRGRLGWRMDEVLGSRARSSGGANGTVVVVHGRM
jgi:hypothetical protein